MKYDSCGKGHPTVLHELKPKPSATNNQAVTTKLSSTAEQASGNNVKEDQTAGHVSLATHDQEVSKSTMILPVYLSATDHSDKEVLTYALLDTQSDTSFIKESTARLLGVNGIDTQLRLSTMTSQNLLISCKRVNGLQVRGHDSETYIQLPPLFTQEDIPASRDSIPTPEMAKNWPHLSRIANKLMPKGKVEVGLLLGYNCPRVLVPREVIPPVHNGPFAQRTDLGWSIVGLIRAGEFGSHCNLGVTQHVCPSSSGVRIVLRTSSKEIMSPNDVLSFFRREEHGQEGKGLSHDDVSFLRKMEDGTRRSEGGHYELPLPLKSQLSEQRRTNRPLALQRLQALVRRFQKDPHHHKLYCDFMNNLFIKGYAEEIPVAELGSDVNVNYLPHHGVYNPSKPGKIRVVMDASAKYLGHCLNNNLLTGPDLMNALVGVLCRFRKEQVAFVCDIEGMFQQFFVGVEHRNLLRFLWLEDGDYRQDPKDFRSTVHLFGVASSPAVANYALKRAATDHEETFGSDVAEFIQRDFYVDDGLASVSTEAEAISLIERSVKLFAVCGLKLHKFVSNSRKVLSVIDEDLRAPKVKDIKIQQLPIERALGIRWCVESDAFQFRIVVKEHALTRRGLLSTVCSMFDPLGFIAPVILEGKIILQMMCKDKQTWDDPLPEDVRRRWERWLRGLACLESLVIDRCYKPSGFGEVKVAELHNFSDASMVGYGQCSYLRLVSVNDQVHCSLVMAKARVAPLKSISVPRLELNAAVISTNVSQLLSRELSYENLIRFFWTDSKIVLSFIANDSKRFHTYVANRVQHIRDIAQPEQWAFVATHVNPADMASRGTNGEILRSSSWFSGPEFLWKKEIVKHVTVTSQLDENDDEVKKTSCLAAKATVNRNLLSELKFSSWKHVKRILGWCICFVENLKQKSRKSLSVNNLVTAERLLVTLTQTSVFEEDIRQLQSSMKVKASSPLAKLDPFLDDFGKIVETSVGSDGLIRKVKIQLGDPGLLPDGHRKSEPRCIERPIHKVVLLVESDE